MENTILNILAVAVIIGLIASLVSVHDVVSKLKNVGLRAWITSALVIASFMFAVAYILGIF
jgi:hypothetical protein